MIRAYGFAFFFLLALLATPKPAHAGSGTCWWVSCDSYLYYDQAANELFGYSRSTDLEYGWYLAVDGALVGPYGEAQRLSSPWQLFEAVVYYDFVPDPGGYHVEATHFSSDAPYYWYYNDGTSYSDEQYVPVPLPVCQSWSLLMAIDPVTGNMWSDATTTCDAVTGLYYDAEVHSQLSGPGVSEEATTVDNVGPAHARVELHGQVGALESTYNVNSEHSLTGAGSWTLESTTDAQSVPGWPSIEASWVAGEGDWGRVGFSVQPPVLGEGWLYIDNEFEAIATDLGSTVTFSFDQRLFMWDSHVLSFQSAMYGMPNLPVNVFVTAEEYVKPLGSTLPIPLTFGERREVITAVAAANVRYQKIQYSTTYGGRTLYEPHGLGSMSIHNPMGGSLPDEVLSVWEFQLGELVQSADRSAIPDDSRPFEWGQPYIWSQTWASPGDYTASRLTFFEFCGDGPGCSVYSFHPEFAGTLD